MPELILFPNDNEIVYFNDCEYTIDSENNRFQVKGNGLKINVTHGNYKFGWQQNIFIAFSNDNETNGFALVFKDAESCNAIFELFEKIQHSNGLTINYFRPTYQKFLTLLFNEIKKNAHEEVTDLRRIASNLSLTDEEKLKFKDILPLQAAAQEVKQELDDEVIIEEKAAAVVIKQEATNNVNNDIPSSNPPVSRPAAVQIELLDVDDEEDENQISTTTTSSENNTLDSTLPKLNDTFETNDGERSRRTKRKNYDENSYREAFGSSEEESIVIPKTKKCKRVSNVSIESENQETLNESFEHNNTSRSKRSRTTRISTTPNSSNHNYKELIKLNDYKLEYFTLPDGDKLQHLTIFDEKNKDLCRTYSFHKSSKSYYCNNCRIQYKNVSVKLEKNHETNEMFGKYGKFQHVCEPQPEGRIIYSPNFEIQKNDDGSIKNLLIFVGKNKQFCYHYYNIMKNRFVCRSKCSKKVGAKIFENDRNEYYIKLSNVPHKCKPQNYIPTNV